MLFHGRQKQGREFVVGIRLAVSLGDFASDLFCNLFCFAFSDAGACINQAESFFSRLRRAEYGQHHRISGAYLAFYAGEMAWREDMRRVDNGNQLRRVGMGALAFGKSRNWTGYWQRAVA